MPRTTVAGRIGAVGLAVLAAGAVLVLMPGTNPSVEPHEPAAFIELERDGRMVLLEYALERQAPPRLIADRPTEPDQRAEWQVAPTGHDALSISRGDGLDRIDLVQTATGAVSWTIDLPVAINVLSGTWSPDGRHWAASGSAWEDAGLPMQRQRLAIVDTVARTAITPDFAGPFWPLGFADDGDLILASHAGPARGEKPVWGLGRLERSTGAIARVGADNREGRPNSVGQWDVDPTIGVAIWITGSGGIARQGHRVELVDLRSGDVRLLTETDEPAVSAVGLSANGSDAWAIIREGRALNLDLFDRGGDRRRLWAGSGVPTDVAQSADGSLLGWTFWPDAAIAIVADVRTGSSRELLLPERGLASVVGLVE